jgi:hypothetical protein
MLVLEAFAVTRMLPMDCGFEESPCITGAGRCDRVVVVGEIRHQDFIDLTNVFDAEGSGWQLFSRNVRGGA